MNNEEEIKQVLLSIIRTGLLRIRAFGYDALPQQCALEADHIHNLPGLVGNLKIELLDYYFNAERLDFIRNAIDPRPFEQDWKQLELLIRRVPGL